MRNMSMDNMTMDSMDDMPMDHHPANHTPMDHMSMMMNYFHFSVQSTILFAGWTTVTWGGKSYVVSTINKCIK